jgi:hypothetical protein
MMFRRFAAFFENALVGRVTRRLPSAPVMLIVKRYEQ